MSWNTLDRRHQQIAERELTDRQLQVFKLWLAGHSSRRIARALDIAEPTARGHLDRALQKIRPHLGKDTAA